MRERRTNVRALPASTHGCAHLSPRDGWGAAFCTVDDHPPRHRASVVLAPQYVEDLTQSPLPPAASTTAAGLTGLDALLRMRRGGDDGAASSSDLPLLEGEGGGGISHSGGDGTTTFHGPISSPSPGAAAGMGGPEGGMPWEGRRRSDEPSSQGQQRHRPSMELNQEEMSFLSSAQFDLDDDDEDPYGPDSMPEPLPLRTTTTAAAALSSSARRDATARTARLNRAAAAKRAPSPASTRPPASAASSGSRTERRASSSAGNDFEDDLRANALIAGALAEHGRQKTARSAAASAAVSAAPDVAAAATDARGSEAESSSAADLDRKPAARRRSRPNGPPARSSQDAVLDAKTNHKRSCPDDDDQEKESSTAPSCCICLDAPDRNDVASIDGCDHRFCFGCIEKWSSRENTCPLCKSRFHKIERVHRPPPTKRRRKGDPPAANGGSGGGGSKVKFSKRVRNRDQRADLTSGNPLLHGLFASMEANGAMPQGIAHLIFSGMAGIHAGPFLVRDRRSSSSRVPPSSRAAAGRASAAAATAQRPPPAPWGVPPGLRGGAASAPSSARSRAASASSSVFPSVHLASLPRGRGGVSDGLAAAAASAIAPLGTAASSDDDWMPPSPPTRPAAPPRPATSVQVRFGSPTATSLRNDDAPFRRNTVLQDPHHQAPAGPWNPASTMTDSDEFDLDDDDDDDDYFSDYDGGETFRSYIERVRSLERERAERAQVAQALDQYVHLQHRAPAAVGPAASAPPAAAATASLGMSMRDIDPTPIRERPSALVAAAAASSLRPTVPYASTAAVSPAVGMGGAAGRAVPFPPAQQQLRGPLAGESADTALEIDDDSDDDDDDVVEILAVGGSI